MKIQDELKPEMEMQIASQDAITLELCAHENADACARGDALDTPESTDAFVRDLVESRLAWTWAVVWFLEWVRR